MNRIIILIVSGLLSVPAAATEALDVRLKRSAAVVGQQVTLGDVLQFGSNCDQLRQTVAPEVIADQLGGATQVTVTYQQVHERFSELGVNLGLVLLQGASQCEVTLQPPVETAEPGDEPSLFGEPRAPRREAAHAPTTLAAHIQAYCQKEWEDGSGEVELDFERGREDMLGLTAPTFTFVIHAQGRERLGLREFRVKLRRNGRTVRTESIFANVRVRRTVLVAAGPLNLGRHVKADDLTTMERVFGSEGTLGLVRSGAAVGQRLRAFVPEGEMIKESDLEASDLVRRGTTVQVYRNGSIGVRLRGTALENGTYGDRIKVRLGESRSSRRVVHGEVTGIGEIRLLESN